jgi:hypothetical protein
MTLPNKLERTWDLRIGRLEVILWIALSLACVFGAYSVGFMMGRLSHEEKKKEKSPIFSLEGELQKITSRNEKNGLTVMRFLPDGSDESIVIVGRYPEARPGWKVRVLGYFINHPQWGRQFVIKGMDELHPNTPKTSPSPGSQTSGSETVASSATPSATSAPVEGQTPPAGPT